MCFYDKYFQKQVAMHSNEAMTKMFANEDNTLSPDEVMPQVIYSFVVML